MPESKFSLAFEHEGEQIAVSIETTVDSETVELNGDIGLVRFQVVPGATERVIDRLAAAAKAALR